MLAGAVAGNPGGTVLGRGLAVLCVAYVVGRMLEWVAEQALLAVPAGSEAAASLEEAVEAAAERMAFADDEGPRSLPLGDAGGPADAVNDPSARMAA